MNDVIGTALVSYACPICGKEASYGIAINEVLTEAKATEVKNFHGKCIGWSENACEECTKHKDEVIYLIGIDPEQSDNNEVYRTGKVVGIKKDAELFNNLDSKFILKTDNEVQFCFIDDSLLSTMIENFDNSSTPVEENV